MVRYLLETPGLLHLPPQLDNHLVAFYHDLRQQKYSHKDFRIHPDRVNDGAITKRLTESAHVLSLPPLPVVLPPSFGPEPCEPRSHPVTAVSEVGASTSKDAAANSPLSGNGPHSTDSGGEVNEANLEEDNGEKVAKEQDPEARTSGKSLLSR